MDRLSDKGKPPQSRSRTLSPSPAAELNGQVDGLIERLSQRPGSAGLGRTLSTSAKKLVRHLSQDRIGLDRTALTLGALDSFRGKTVAEILEPTQFGRFLLACSRMFADSKSGGEDAGRKQTEILQFLNQVVLVDFPGQNGANKIVNVLDQIRAEGTDGDLVENLTTLSDAYVRRFIAINTTSLLRRSSSSSIVQADQRPEITPVYRFDIPQEGRRRVSQLLTPKQLSNLSDHAKADVLGQLVESLIKMGDKALDHGYRGVTQIIDQAVSVFDNDPAQLHVFLVCRLAGGSVLTQAQCQVLLDTIFPNTQFKMGQEEVVKRFKDFFVSQFFEFESSPQKTAFVIQQMGLLISQLAQQRVSGWQTLANYHYQEVASLPGIIETRNKVEISEKQWLYDGKEALKKNQKDLEKARGSLIEWIQNEHNRLEKLNAFILKLEKLSAPEFAAIQDHLNQMRVHMSQMDEALTPYLSTLQSTKVDWGTNAQLQREAVEAFGAIKHAIESVFVKNIDVLFSDSMRLWSFCDPATSGFLYDPKIPKDQQSGKLRVGEGGADIKRLTIDDILVALGFQRIQRTQLHFCNTVRAYFSDDKESLVLAQKMQNMMDFINDNGPNRLATPQSTIPTSSV